MNDKQGSGTYRLSLIGYSSLRLVRPINLLIIAFTMYMVRYCLLLPEARLYSGKLMINSIDFALFALGILLMAAAGYIINDYYDLEIDEINKPGKTIIGRHIKPSNAIALYQIINLIGLFVGCYAVFKMDLPWEVMGLPWVAGIFPFYVVILWLYSRYLKSVFFVGNLVVSLCIALVPLVTGLTELTLQTNLSRESFIVIYFITVFAFLASLAREIIKDAEDMYGDAKAGCKTIPVVIGLTWTKRIVQGILICLFILVCFWGYNENIWPSNLYLFVFVELPIALLVIKINGSKTKQDFHKYGNWLKLLMVSGICYLFVVAYLLLK